MGTSSRRVRCWSAMTWTARKPADRRQFSYALRVHLDGRRHAGWTWRKADGPGPDQRQTGLNVVAATGAHCEVHYPAGHWLRSATEDELAARFHDDIELGMQAAESEGTSGVPPRARVRAGLIKTGIGYWSVSRFERRVLAAAAHTHERTGVAIMVHLEHSAAVELLTMLGALGVSPDAVVLAHVDRNPDPVLHAELAAAGCYLGYDGFADEAVARLGAARLLHPDSGARCRRPTAPGWGRRSPYPLRRVRRPARDGLSRDEGGPSTDPVGTRSSGRGRPGSQSRSAAGKVPYLRGCREGDPCLSSLCPRYASR